MDRRIAAVAVRQVGLVTRQQLLHLGLHPEAIRRRVLSGRLETVQNGIFRMPGYPKTWDQRLMAALLIAGGGSAISFDAAAMIWQIDAIRTDRPHVTVVHAQKIKNGEMIVHRTRLIAPGDVVHRGPLRVTSPWRTIFDLAGVLSRDALEDALDDAIRRRIVTVTGLAKRFDLRGRRGVRGVARLSSLLADRTGSRPKASTLQNRFRRGLMRAGLPIPEEELDIYDNTGRWIARVDFAYRALRLAIEIDGSHHETRKQREADLIRQNKLVRAGWRPLRFTKHDVEARTYVAELAEVFSGESPATSA